MAPISDFVRRPFTESSNHGGGAIVEWVWWRAVDNAKTNSTDFTGVARSRKGSTSGLIMEAIKAYMKLSNRVNFPP